MSDWSTIDTTRLSEEDFPIRCDGCERDLTGLGEAGRCPDCDLAFSRRLRLWQTYGPEAFADPPITPAEQEASQKDITFLSALLAGLIVTLSLPVLLLAWLAMFDTVDLCSCLLVWAVISSIAVWLTVVRRLFRGSKSDHETTEDDENGGESSDRGTNDEAFD